MENQVAIVKTRRSYTLETKRNILRALCELTQQKVADSNKIQASLLAKRRLSLGTPGRKEIPPGGN
ncbi:unnamed protein product, partial [Aphanomyces euteiches]